MECQKRTHCGLVVVPSFFHVDYVLAAEPVLYVRLFLPSFHQIADISV